MAVRSAKVISDSDGAAAKSAGPATATKRRSALMSIRVHYDVGLGNRITVRGDTDPFRWDSGIDAQNTADDVWEFQIARIVAGKSFQFKPLINDAIYASGDNYVATGRQTLDIYPTF